MTAESTFERANIIEQISGCLRAIARNLTENLPIILNISRYQHQAQKLVRVLGKMCTKVNIRQC